jgi:hypothetical protein
MRYRKPFTPEQRRDAQAKYLSYRRNVRLLGRIYAPSTTAQRSMLRDYQDIVHEFGLELRKLVGQVDVVLLNRLDEKAAATYLEYMASKMKGAGRT